MPTPIVFRPIAPSLYTTLWDRFGGSFITHPSVLSRLAETVAYPVAYFGLYEHGRVRGAVPAWGDWIAGHFEALDARARERWLELDTGQPEFILPVDPDVRFELPFRAKRLSSLHQDQINGIEPTSGVESRFQMLARPHSGAGGFSQATRKKLNRMLKRITDAGARILPITALTPDDLAAAYAQLYTLRWPGTQPRGRDQLCGLFGQWRGLLFGHCVRLDGRVIALDICYQVSSARCLYIEAVQGAWDPDYAELSPGSVVMLVNTREAWARASAAARPLRFSFGYAGEQPGYKHLWCIPQPLYETSPPRVPVQVLQ